MRFCVVVCNIAVLKSDTNLIFSSIISLDWSLIKARRSIAKVSLCVQVRLGSRHTQHCPLSVKRRSLSHSRCVELANHFLGFNGWRTDIIAVRNNPATSHLHTQVNVRWLHASDLQLEQLSHEDEAAEGGEPFRRLKFGCQLELCFPHHRQSIKAAAVVEDSFTCTGKNSSAPRRPDALSYVVL